MMRIAFYVGIITGVVIYFNNYAHAETMAVKVFGSWEKVTVQEIRKPVPEYDWPRHGLGAVQRPVKTEIVGCPIYEGSEVIGWSMTCQN